MQNKLMKIPNNLTHIWIGPKDPPLTWMNSWPEKHPNWNYRVFDNELLANTTFYNREFIDLYINKEVYCGAADLIRYELLYNHGGFIPPADALCLHNTDELWDMPEDFCYTVYESETIRPGYVSPIYAANPKNKFLEIIIEELHKTDLSKVSKKAFMVTGNAFLSKMIDKHKPDIKIFPSYTFIPVHFKSPNNKYCGPGKVYSEQYWGSTRKTYDQGK